MKNNKNITDFKELKRQQDVFEELMDDKGFFMELLIVSLKTSLKNGDKEYNIAYDARGDTVKAVYERLCVKEKLFDHSSKPIEDQIKSYMVKTIKNRTLYYHNKDKKERKYLEQSLEEANTNKHLFEANQEDVQLLESYREIFENYQEVLEKVLRKKKRTQILRLRLQGSSYKEIALKVGSNANAVRVSFNAIKKTTNKFFKCVSEFEKFNKELSDNDLKLVSDKLNISERTVVSYYNCLKNTNVRPRP